ncbi:PLAT/LH2 domain-containing protein [Streptomyces sp. NBC_01351]|uniref:PLAT/LH2 domain-containing protein n=1 Tax=Streptomyces sp. NBC_01351 TaxID=2903833 RepID=UPI002E2F4213|nr:PLAT/LH2 domain-containing protein [Streptomyces sp. NBC_01351]
MWDPDETEVLPSAAGHEVSSTRPLPRIDGNVRRPGPARRRRIPKGVWAGAALVACAAGGLTVGALTGGPAEPSAGKPPTVPPSPTPTTPDQAPAPDPTASASSPAPRPTGAAAYQVTLRTADVAEAGTDSDVQGRLTDETGRTSAWTVLDTHDHNDFEAGARATYVVAVPAGFGRPAAFQLWKGGKDAWAVEGDVRLTGPAGYAAVWRPTDSPSRLWITGGEAAPADGTPVFTAYSPNGTLSRSTP